MYRLVDLFAGAGGFTMGFLQHFGNRVKSVWANDLNSDAAKTYNLNFGEHCECGDILELLSNGQAEIPSADIVIGGPPCQGFSLLNKRREGDPRKELWRPYLEVVKLTGARVFIMENVRSLLGTPEHEAIIKSAKSMGFKVASQVLCAADYGVPQMRYRAFIIGTLNVDPNDFFPPKRTHFNPETGPSNFFDYIPHPEPYRTVSDAIADLPEPRGTEMGTGRTTMDLHFGRNPTSLSIARYKAIPDEGMNRFDLQRLAPELTIECWTRKKTGGSDLFGRLWWKRPSVTIRTEFFKPEKGRYLHPVQDRPITHREAARLQSFPDNFKFIGSKIEVAKQIGNAVPPLLAKKIAEIVDEMLA